MKRLLGLVIVAGSLAACNGGTETPTEKKDTATATTTTTTTTTTATTTPAAAATSDAPKFADADVQKLADEYTAFVKEAAGAGNDPAKVAEYTKKAQEWATKMQPAMQKLATQPEELKKWTDYMQKLALQMQAQAK